MKINQKKIAPYAFISPFIILFIIFGLYPIGYSIYISFFKWKLCGPVAFIGLANYKKLLTTDPFFFRTIKNTVILLFTGSLLQHFFAIPLAIMLNNKLLKGRNLFKAAYFLPYITSTVAVTLIFSQLFDTNFGWLNFIIKDIFGSEKVLWLTDPTAIKASLSIILNWKYIGWNTIIYLAGLQAIPSELYEAAIVDGATKLQQHFKITLPLLLPIIFFAVTLSIIGGMQIFDEPYVLLGGYDMMGGPRNSGLTAAFYLLYTAFRAARLGRGSAIAWLLFFIILIMTLINKYITRKLEK